MTYKDSIMHYSTDALIDDAEMLQNKIYDLLDNQIHISKEKDKAINISVDIIDNLNLLDEIISELATRVENNRSENFSRSEDSHFLEEGKDKLKDFEFAESTAETVCTECKEDDFTELIKNFIGGKLGCD